MQAMTHYDWDTLVGGLLRFAVLDLPIAILGAASGQGAALLLGSGGARMRHLQV